MSHRPRPIITLGALLLASTVTTTAVGIDTTPAVVHAAPTLDDPKYLDGSQWGLNSATSTPSNQYGIGLADAWASGHTGRSDIAVAIIGTGIDTSHVDLAGNIWTNTAEIAGNGIDDDDNGYIDDVNGWDFLNDDATVYDNAQEDTYGTQLAGIIGAVGGNGIGVAGVNENVSIIPLKVSDLQSSIASADIVDAIEYVSALRTSGVNVVAALHLWGCVGGPGCGDSDEMAALESLAANGVLSVAGAGDEATDNGTAPVHPSNLVCDVDSGAPATCVLSVAAHDSTGELTRSAISTYRTGSNVGSTVDLSAPGLTHSTAPGDTYADISGSSVAAAFATGAVALCASIDDTATPADLHQRIVASAAPLAAATGTIPGGGRLDLAAMVDACTTGDGTVTGTVSLGTLVETGPGLAEVTIDDDTTGATDLQLAVGPVSDGRCTAPARTVYLEPAATTATIDFLQPDTTHCVRIRAVDITSGDATPWSRPIAFHSTPDYTCEPTTYDLALQTAGLAGAALTLTNDGDSFYTAPSTFSFDFYGVERTGLTITDDGYLRFAAQPAGTQPYFDIDNQFGPYSYPSRNLQVPDAAISAWNTTARFAAGGDALIGVSGDWFIVTWKDLEQVVYNDQTFVASGAITSQVALNLVSDEIRLQVVDATTADAASGGTSATIGVMSDGGRLGTAVHSASGGLNDRTAWSCTWAPTDQRALAYSVSGSGAVSLDSDPDTVCLAEDACADGFTTGTAVTLTAVADDGWEFTGWSGECSGTASTCSITMDDDTTVHASFAETPDVFVPVTPARLLDTRSGVGALAARVGALDGSGAALTLQVTGRGGVPSSGVAAVALNVTVVDGAANDFGGFVTVYPCDVGRPDASNLNFVSGQTVPNAVIAPVSADGTVCLYVYGTAHLLADVSGFFVSGFEPVTPARLLDTRPSGTRVGALDGSGAAYELQVSGRGGVPATGVSAVALNVTVVDGQANDFGGFVTVYPCGSRPDASNLNFVSGQTVPNSVIAPVSASGTVCLYVYGTAHLLADVSGFFVSGFEPATPARLLDTRPSGTRVGALDGSGAAYELQVTGRGGVPTTGVSAVALNVTVVDGQSNDFGGYVTVYPCDVARPDASNLNFVSGQTVPNAVIAPVSADGTVCLYVYGTAHLLVDVSGYL